MQEAFCSTFYMDFSEAIRTTLWQQAALHQWGQGLQEGVDLTVAEKLIADLDTAGRLEEKGMLITSLCAGCWPRSRLYEAGYIADPVCPRCGVGPETLMHRYWECRARN